MEPFSSIGINILSSILYDIGKVFVNNDRKPLSEKQMLKIIDTFQNEIDCMFYKLNKLESELGCIKHQNEIIFKMLLMIFDNNSDISISYTGKGYLIEGNYTLSNLTSVAQGCLDRYTRSLPSAPPQNLSEAIWPIPQKMKGELLDEIENTIYREDC